MPSASSSRNLAGRKSRPLSSSRGEWVPRNTAPPPLDPSRRCRRRADSPLVLHHAPPYPTSLHRSLNSFPTAPPLPLDRDITRLVAPRNVGLGSNVRVEERGGTWAT